MKFDLISKGHARKKVVPITESPSPGDIMSYADEVRAYCSRHYVQPARASGKKEISIRAGDVHDAMSYRNRMPLICSAVGTKLFTEMNGLRRTAVEGPLNGANTVFRFELID